jgi:hypothetical protein
MTTTDRSGVPSRVVADPRAARAFGRIRQLIGAYLGISVAALVAIVLMRDDAAEVNSAVWTRATIVVVTGVLLVLVAGRAARGSRGAFRRLRIVTVVIPVVIVILVALPGPFPLWLKVEQAACGLVMAAAAAIANGRPLRRSFARAE